MEHSTVKSLQIGGRAVWLCDAAAKGQRGRPVVILPSGTDAPQELAEFLPLVEGDVRAGRCRPFLLASFASEDWNRDYSPWDAPALYRRWLSVQA